MKKAKLFIPLLLLCSMFGNIFFAACNETDDHHDNLSNQELPDKPSVDENNEEDKKDENNEEKEEDKKIEVASIFISKSELTLGIEEREQLIATVSPANAETMLSWSSSNSSVAEVDQEGNVTAKSQGSAVISVKAENGVLAVCNVTVKIKTGSVMGEVTWKYNNYVGNKPDTGAKVIMISETVTSLPDSLGLGLTSNLPVGVYATTVSGTGKYNFDNIPIGKYYLIIISKNTNENPDRVMGFSSWGAAYFLFSEKGQENALLLAQVYKTRSTTIEVLYEETTTYSYDFGITYI